MSRRGILRVVATYLSPEVSMFTRLLASAAPNQRSGVSLAVSVAAHLAIGAGAIVLTAARPMQRRVEHKPLIYVTPPSAPPVEVPTMPSGTPGAPSSTVPPLAVPHVATVDLSAVVPNVLPDVGDPLANPAAGWSRGTFVPTESGTGGTTVGSRGAGDPLDAASVEFPVELLPGSMAPRYPEVLRNAGVEGQVRVRFVVDTLGAVEPGSVTILEATNPLFATAVREALLRQRFRAALVGKRRVRQLVEEPFVFSIRR